MNEINLDEISDVIIETQLIRVVKQQLSAEYVKICVEAALRKGVLLTYLSHFKLILNSLLLNRQKTYSFVLTSKCPFVISI